MRSHRRFTIDQIAERLALPRTTVYYWVRALPVADEIQHSSARQAARRKGTRAMQRRYRLLREQAYREGLESFDELARDPTFRDFLALYVAEGYKRTRHTASICNSDPAVMRTATRWLRSLTDRSLNYSIQYHADQDLDTLRAFWGSTLSIDGDLIRLTRKSNSNQLSGRTWRSAHGVLAVSVHDTLLRARLQAWTDRLRASWG